MNENWLGLGCKKKEEYDGGVPLDIRLAVEVWNFHITKIHQISSQKIINSITWQISIFCNNECKNRSKWPSIFDQWRTMKVQYQHQRKEKRSENTQINSFWNEVTFYYFYLKILKIVKIPILFYLGKSKYVIIELSNTSPKFVYSWRAYWDLSDGIWDITWPCYLSVSSSTIG